MANKGNPSERFDRVLAGSWPELQEPIRTFMPGLRPPASLVPDKESAVLWVLSLAVGDFPSHRSDPVVQGRAKAFCQAGTAWLALYSLKARYESLVYKGADEQRAALKVTEAACQRLTREALPRLRGAFDRTPHGWS
jgi:hypothetical protein